MKKVKLSAKDRYSLELQLKSLLYRKNTVEHDIQTRLTGANVYSAYLDSIGSFESLTGQDKLNAFNSVIKVREYISVYQYLKLEYNDFIIPKIKETVQALGLQMEDQKIIDLEQKVKQLSLQDKVDAVTEQPANVEIPEMIEAMDSYCDVLTNLIDSLDSSLKEENVSAKDKAFMEKTRFEESLRLKVLTRRLNARKDYYYNQFLPRYEKDMAECAIYFDAYLKRGTDMVEKGIDPKLGAMLQQYEGHKDDREKLWLFWTALKDRVDKIRDYILLNRDKMNEFLYLANPIIDVQQNTPLKVVKGRTKSKK